MQIKQTLLFLLVFWTVGLHAQKDSSYELPGKGLNQHPFLYVGEWDTRHPEAQSIFLVRDSKLVWQYSIPMKTPSGGIQEFDKKYYPCFLPNIAFACMSGAGIITPEKKILWKFD